MLETKGERILNGTPLEWNRTIKRHTIIISQTQHS